MRRLAALLSTVGLLALALAGCGSSAPAPAGPTPQAVAGNLGCTDAVPTGKNQPLVRDSARCTVNGESVTIYTFPSQEVEDGWAKAGGMVGGGGFVVGPQWVVTAPSQETAAQVQARLGGTIR